LEPQRTNRFPNSEYSGGFSLGSAITATDNAAISPEGVQNAIKIEKTTNGYAYFRSSAIAALAGCLSVFAKKGNYRYIGLRNNQTSGVHSVFDFDTETFVNVATGQTCTFEDYGNGWYRLIAYQPNNEFSSYQGVAMTDSNGNESIGSFVPNGSHFFIYGLQQEASATYPTSYIPTMGTAQTRAADSCSGSENSVLFNKTEGVLFLESSALAEGDDKRISLSDGTMSNYVSIGYSRFSGNIIAEMVSGGVSQQPNWGATGVTQTDNNKFALSWGSGTMKFYVNGVQTLTESVTSPVGLDILRFSAGNSSLRFDGETKQLAVFNEALSDSELATLTTL
jgi:hypothetical protein